jgi:hypothetical protein
LNFSTSDLRGTKTIIKGSLASQSELPESGASVGDIYVIDGDGFVWDGVDWDNIGSLQGPPGVVQSINGKSAAEVILTTSDIAESSTNLYYTDARVRGAVSGGTGVTYTPATGVFAIGQSVGVDDRVSFKSVAFDYIGAITVQETTTSSTDRAIINAGVAQVQKLLVSIKDNVTDDVHVAEVLMFRKGAEVSITVYAEMHSSAAPLASFTGSIPPTGPGMGLLATPVSANNTTFKVVRIGLN